MKQHDYQINPEPYDSGENFTESVVLLAVFALVIVATIYFLLNLQSTVIENPDTDLASADDISIATKEPLQIKLTVMYGRAYIDELEPTEWAPKEEEKILYVIISDLLRRTDFTSPNAYGEFYLKLNDLNIVSRDFYLRQSPENIHLARRYAAMGRERAFRDYVSHSTKLDKKIAKRLASL